MKPSLARQLRYLVDAQRRTQTAVDSMASGSLAGRTVQAAPLPERPRAGKYTLTTVGEAAAWSTQGHDLTVSPESDIYEVLEGGNLILLILNLSAALTGDTDVELSLNGVVVGTVTVASGQTRGEELLAEPTVPGDLLTVESTVVGVGSATATTQARIGT